MKSKEEIEIDKNMKDFLTKLELIPVPASGIQSYHALLRSMMNEMMNTQPITDTDGGSVFKGLLDAISGDDK